MNKKIFGGGIEFEAKFLNIDVNKIKSLLFNKLKAKQVHEQTKFIRCVYHLCDGKITGFVRIRKEHNKITMTTKLYRDPKFPEEYEIELNSSFDDGIKFLEAIGLKKKSYHETLRITYVVPSMPDVHEIVIDDVPGLPTYIEIDCKNEAILNEVINILELDKASMRFGAYSNTYNEYYGIDIDVINNKTPSLTFKNIINEIHPKKNKNLLIEISKLQQKYLL